MPRVIAKPTTQDVVRKSSRRSIVKKPHLPGKAPSARSARLKKTGTVVTDKPAMLVRSKTVVGGEVNPSEVPVLAEPSPEECETVWPELPKIRGKGKLSDKQITAAVMRAISAVNARHAAQSAGATDASDI